MKFKKLKTYEKLIYPIGAFIILSMIDYWKSVNYLWYFPILAVLIFLGRIETEEEKGIKRGFGTVGGLTGNARYDKTKL